MATSAMAEDPQWAKLIATNHSCHNPFVRILMSAGEASGEAYGAKLMEALRHQAAQRGESSPLEFFGVGGQQMHDAGCDLIVDAQQIAVVGLAEVVEHLPRIYRRFRDVVRQAEGRKPDAAILIDFPDFNFRLAKELHTRGIPVIYYVSPQLWAWRPSRIELVRKYVRKMLVIFPFEEKFYRQRGIEAEFVGHPLVDLPVQWMRREQFAAEHQLDAHREWIALLPGSRRGEVSRIFPTLLEAAQLLGPDYVYTVPVASTLDSEWIASFLRRYSGPSVRFTRDARTTLKYARVAAIASGTSTLEAALIGTPFTMVYRVAPLTWSLGRRLVSVDRFAMVNLIAERDVVVELVQEEFSADRVAGELQRLLPEGGARAAMLAEFRDVRHKLEPGEAEASPSERAARAVFRVLDGRMENHA